MADLLISGFDDIYKSIEDLDFTDKEQEIALRKVGVEAMKDAKNSSQRIADKGILAKSWTIRFSKKENPRVTIYSKAHHDIDNEFGSERNSKHIGFFSRTMDENKDKYMDIIKEALKK